MPGPCDPEDLLDGVVFGAKYLGSTQLKSEKNPSTNARMSQAQEAVDRIKVNSTEDGRHICALCVSMGHFSSFFFFFKDKNYGTLSSG